MEYYYTMVFLNEGSLTTAYRVVVGTVELLL